jgi:hypothetical protein
MLKSILIDPKVLPMSRKHLAECETSILRLSSVAKAKHDFCPKAAAVSLDLESASHPLRLA